MHPTVGARTMRSGSRSRHVSAEVWRSLSFTNYPQPGCASWPVNERGPGGITGLVGGYTATFAQESLESRFDPLVCGGLSIPARGGGCWTIFDVCQPRGPS